MTNVGLREAVLADAAAVWRWRNDPITRAFSYNSAPISYDDHLQWVATRLVDRCRHTFIAVDGAGTGMGFVRLDVSGDTADISLALDPAVRGRGYGSALIQCACKFASDNLRLTEVVANVKRENRASIQCFHKAGFIDDAECIIAGCASLRMRYPLTAAAIQREL